MNDQAAPDMEKLLDELPDSTVTIRGGRVVSLSDWTLWNLVPIETMSIAVDDNGKVSGQLCWGDGGTGLHGDDLATVLEPRLHPDIRGPIIEAFALRSADKAAVEALLPRYQIVVED